LKNILKTDVDIELARPPNHNSTNWSKNNVENKFVYSHFK